jgi:protein TonB
MQPMRPIQTSLIVRRMEASPAATVGLRVHVDAQGNVLHAAVYESGGSSAMDGAALAAMRKMTFVPYRENGVPMAVTVMVPLHFPEVAGR